ncbi:MarR family transcriptional regulator [Rhodococcus sp. HNM0569]|uniref:MarR family winged helix-turn-helix transcriptional regulator n=1 Tax=Rhodococcus sp. HNM0569 TaxID=2716340 RepID=UPI00146B55D8|nr:MarR family transcriptional regulator [Rhodococcus sp. HNM0569]NLU84638.1 MarR family transcriptional regulator [Rhodococcus sp. HNM0569]
MSIPADGDFTDRVQAEWQRAYPQVDTGPIAVLGRITRIGSQALQQLEHALAHSDVTRAEFEVLCVLARHERPLRTSEVTAATLLSNAAITKQVDRLAARGLVERQRFERDGRVVLIELTDDGRAVVDREFPLRLERDRRVLEGLDQTELDTLADLLRKLSLNMDAGSHR